MAEQAVDPTSTTYYALRPIAPVRAWVLAALLVIAGAVALYLGVTGRGLYWIIGGGFGLGLGLFLVLLGVILITARTQHITFSPEGFQVLGPGYERSGEWADVTAVNTTPDGSRIVIACGRVPRTFIQSPGGMADETIKQLTADLMARLG